MIYVTLIVSSNGSGDVSSWPLIPGLFWRHLLLSNFLVGHHTKVVIHSVSLSLPLSPLRWQSYLKAQTTEQWPSHVQGGYRIVMSSLTGTEQPHKRTFPGYSTSAPTFSKHPFIYMHVLVCFAVECKTVCNQSCVSDRRT
jgi:hypothetical protein